MASRVCGTCSLAGGDKYKCSTCRTFKYCSVACFKKHQESGCGKPAAATNAGGAAGAGSAVATAGVSTAAAPALQPTTVAAPPSLPPKSSNPTVAAADLDALARDPLTLAALSSTELRRILHLIDSGGATNGDASTTTTSAASDESRVAMLEKYRRSNPEFEQFVQNTLEVINQETR
jgi:hypothetical protein